MRHQRPSSAKRGAASFQVAGSSTRGGCAGGGVAHPRKMRAAEARLLRSMRRMVWRQVVGMGDGARALDLFAQLLGAARLAQPARGEQLEEHRHEEDREEG